MMDHLDKLDYAFLGFSVAGFLLCVVAMWRQKPHRQIEARLLQRKNKRSAAPRGADKRLQPWLKVNIGSAHRQSMN